MGRNGHGPKCLWAEMVMGRNDPLYKHANYVTRSLDLSTFVFKIKEIPFQNCQVFL